MKRKCQTLPVVAIPPVIRIETIVLVLVVNIDDHVDFACNREYVDARDKPFLREGSDVVCTEFHVLSAIRLARNASIWATDEMVSHQLSHNAALELFSADAKLVDRFTCRPRPRKACWLTGACFQFS